MLKVEAENVSLENLRQNSEDGFTNKIYRFVMEIPLEYLQRTETGALMAFNVTERNLTDFMLGVKRAYINSVDSGIANVSVEIGEPYLDLALRDLNKVKGVVVLIPEE